MYKMEKKLYTEDYNEISFVVKDCDKRYGKELKNLGGRWNTNLIGGPGWLFNKKRHGKTIEYWLISKKNEFKYNVCNILAYVIYFYFVLSAFASVWYLVE
jgi:hypothetical protein